MPELQRDMLLIGSQAQQYFTDVSLVDSNSDWDVICPPETNFESDWRIEKHDIDFLNNRRALEEFKSDRYAKVGQFWMSVCHPEGLCSIKRSHLHRPRGFARNMWLYRQFSEVDRRLDALAVSQKVDCFLTERIKLTKKEFGDKVPSLNQTNEEFFDDAVPKYFVHDDIHRIVAHFDEPLYEKMKSDKSLAKCERSMWEQFSPEEKKLCVLEECYVIGLERFVIPERVKGTGKGLGFSVAATKALEKVCTTLCSGWFRDYAIDNYVEIIKMIDRKRMSLFFDSSLWKEREIAGV